MKQKSLEIFAKIKNYNDKNHPGYINCDFNKKTTQIFKTLHKKEAYMSDCILYCLSKNINYNLFINKNYSKDFILEFIDLHDNYIGEELNSKINLLLMEN